MCKIISKDGISLRKMEDSQSDYALIAKWLSDEEVLKFYEGRDNPFDLEKAKAKFNPEKIKSEGITPCIIEIHDKSVGYLQFYSIDEGEKYWKNLQMDSYENPYGIDLFIGEISFQNKGYGTKIMKMAVEYIFSNFTNAVFIDPQTRNKRAIKCYEKAGFKPLGIVPAREWHEGEYRDSLIMLNLKGGSQNGQF